MIAKIFENKKDTHLVDLSGSVECSEHCVASSDVVNTYLLGVRRRGGGGVGLHRRGVSVVLQLHRLTLQLLVDCVLQQSF
uniref:Uncharacterized protein n=1 Tax=Pristionchus pacificus TaxID=54126 RepID=A0A2A6CDN2_PRIPA|eukprot:PDM76219.1 hypothetical protein PRIPAC_39823 [Pristionchus pacificus]